MKLGCCLQTLRRVQNEIGAKFLTECLKLIKHYCLLLTTSLSGYTCETFWVVLIYCNAVKERNACSMSPIFTLKIINHLTEHLLSSFITVTVLFLKTIPFDTEKIIRLYNHTCFLFYEIWTHCWVVYWLHSAGRLNY